MKKYLNLLFCLLTLSIHAQKDNGKVAAIAGGGLAAIGLAALQVHEINEMLEQNATEWILANWDYQEGDIFEIKSFAWEFKSFGDLSTTNNLLFKIKKNDEDYKLLAFITSNGWINQFGVDFSILKPIIINKSYWEDILLTTIRITVLENQLEILPTNELKTKLKLIKGEEIIKVDAQFRLEELTNIKLSATKISFEKRQGSALLKNDYNLIKLKGDQHLIGKLNSSDFVLDYNEKKINLYLKETGDLIKISRSFVNDITDLLLFQ